MIKRVLSLIILFVLPISLYSIQLGEDVLDVAFAGAKSGIDFGVSSKEIKSINDDTSSIELDYVDFVLQDNSSFRQASFYIWWKVYTRNAITITLSEFEPLKANNSTIEINWQSPLAINGTKLSSKENKNATIYISGRDYPIAGSQYIVLQIPSNELKQGVGKYNVFSGSIKVTISYEG